MEIITAGDGTAHVSSADDGAIFAGIAGAQCYVTNVGEKLSCSMQSANSALVGTGVGFMYGRAFRVASPESVTIESGTQNQRRIDIICAHFKTSHDGKESGELCVIKGVPTSSQDAADPSVPSGDILQGATDAYMPLYRIKLDGINASDPEPLFSILTPIADIQASVGELRDSVSHTRLLSEKISFKEGYFDCELVEHHGMLVLLIDGRVNSASRVYSDHFLSGLIPERLRPSRQTNVSFAPYAGDWGRFQCRAAFYPDGRVRISILSPQAISTGYTSQALCLPI